MTFWDFCAPFYNMAEKTNGRAYDEMLETVREIVPGGASVLEVRRNRQYRIKRIIWNIFLLLLIGVPIVARKHNKPITVMEPVKSGALASVRKKRGSYSGSITLICLSLMGDPVRRQSGRRGNDA